MSQIGPIADWILKSGEIKKRLEEIKECSNFLQRRDVVTRTRFALYPDGALHLGHARTIILNAIFSFLNEGEFIFIFDDTDPEKIDGKFYRWAIEDLKWLGITPDEVSKVSDIIHLYHEQARELIAEGHAYLCNCPPKTDKEREERNKTSVKRNSCRHRENSINDNLKIFERLLNGFEKAYAVKLKMPSGEQEYHKWEIVNENPAKWVELSEKYPDWVMLRYKHPPYKSDSKVLPTMHFSVCVFDKEYQISDIIRGADHINNEPPQKMLHSILKSPPMEYTHLSKIGAKYSSTSEIKKAIEGGELSSWDSPGFFTLRALRRRGIRPEVIWSHILSMEIQRIGTDKNKKIEIDEKKLGKDNSIYYKDRVPKHTFITDPCKIIEQSEGYFGKSLKRLENAPKVDMVGDGTCTKSKFSEIWIAKSDLEQSDGKIVYLKEFGAYNMTKDNEAIYERSKMVKDDLFVYWLPCDEKYTVPSKLIRGSMHSGTEQSLDGVVERKCEIYPKGTMIYLHKIGYVRVESQNPTVFIFGHS